MDSENNDLSLSNFLHSTVNKENQEFFEIIMPKKKTNPVKYKKETLAKPSKPLNFLKKSVGESQDYDDAEIEKLKLKIIKTITEKIMTLRKSIELNKIEKLIKKQIIPFFCDQEQIENYSPKRNVKVVFLKVNDNLNDCLEKFNKMVKDELNLKEYEISELKMDHQTIRDLKKKINKDPKIKICLLYSEISEDISSLNNTLKLIYEEICSFENSSICLIFPVFSHFSDDNCNIMNLHSKIVEFYNSKHLFSNFLYNLLIDVNFFPLFEINIFKKMIDNFEYYNISFNEAIRRLKVIILGYFQSITSMEDLILLNSFVHQEDLKNNHFLKTKMLIGDGRAIIKSAFLVFEDILKNLCKITQKRKMKLISYILGKKQFKFPSIMKENLINSSDSEEIENYANMIIETIKTSQFNIKKTFDDFAEVKFSSLCSTTEAGDIKKSAFHKNDKRLQKLAKIAPKTTFLTSDKIIKLMEVNLGEFLEKFVLKKLNEIQEDNEIVFLNEKIYKFLDDSIHPDILGDIHSSIMKENREEINESRNILKIFEGFGRQFDLNEAYAHFMKEKNKIEIEDENEQSNLSFFYSLNELKYLGFISTRTKSKLILNKNIFAKTFYHDYSQKINKQ